MRQVGTLPTAGELWRAAYEATKDLPSWSRGQECRSRYDVAVLRENLLRTFEVPGPIIGRVPARCLFCGQTWRGLDQAAFGNPTRCCGLSRMEAVARLTEPT